MAMIIRAGVAALLVTTVATAQIRAAPDWDLADAQTVRLAPEEIAALPPPIRQGLTQLGCTIPQVAGAVQPGNFIAGRFSSSSRTQIAVLCSRNRSSSILVFEMGSAKPAAELAPAPDKEFLQIVDGNGGIGFSRLLSVVQPQTIRTAHANSGVLELPSLDHDGIEDAFVEKGSRVWYRNEERWLQLAGSD